MKNIFFILTIVSVFIVNAKREEVFCFKLEGEINTVSSRYVSLALKKAKRDSAAIIIMEMNTYGGAVFDAEAIVDEILAIEIPVWVFINKNAGSAGSFISVACDSIFMAKGAFIGASSVMNENGEILPEKIQSAMRSKFRTIAEATDKDPNLCEMFVGKNLSTDSAFVLSLTTREAIDKSLCIAQYPSINNLIENEIGKDYKKVDFSIQFSDKIIGWLIHPIFKSILILMIVGGLIIELKTPGIGVPITIAIFGAILYFLPDYLHGLLEHWELIVFLVGFLFLALEIFVIPGFGIAGVSGISLILLGLFLSMVKNKGFDFDYVSSSALESAFIVITIGSVSSFVLLVIGFTFLIKTKSFKKLTVSEVIEKKAVPDNSHLVGEEGIVFSILRLGGKVEINDHLYDAISVFGHIEKGERIEVVACEGIMLKVKKI